MSQDSVDTALLSRTVKDDLKSHSLLFHRDKGVKALTACCLADMLKLYAPDAPYSNDELKDIFGFFIHQLRYISDQKHTYFPNYFYLLESLSTVKSIVLVADLDNSEELMLDLFTDFFQNAVGSDTTDIVYNHILDILFQLIQECTFIPVEVVAILISCFEKRNQSLNPTALRLATDLANNATDKLQRYVCQYFSDLIISCSKMSGGVGGEDDMDDMHDDNESHHEINSSAALIDAHKLILEIYAVAPGVLLSVIPQLEEELKVENVHVRSLSTQVMGHMFSSVDGVQLAATYPSVWRNWVDRRNDTQVSIRIDWIESLAAFFSMQHSIMLIPELCEHLERKLMDPEEKVRYAVLKLIASFSPQTSASHTLPVSLLKEVANRCKDKKSNVRIEAISVLARLYNLAFEQIADGNNLYVTRFAWIPGHLLDLLYISDTEIIILVEKAFHEFILPPSTDDKKRTDRLLYILDSFADNDKTRKAFLSMIERQALTMRNFSLFVDQCEKYNGGVMDQDEELITDTLHQIISHLSSRLPDPKKATAHLLKFAQTNEKRCYQLVRGLANPATDYKTVLKYNKELMKRLDVQHVTETLSIVIRRMSLTLLNKSCLPRLMERIVSMRKVMNAATTTNDGDGAASSQMERRISLSRTQTVALRDVDDLRLGAAAESIIQDISRVFPVMYKSHISDFTELLDSNDKDLVTGALHALSQFVKAFPQESIDMESHLSKLKELALSEEPSLAENSTIVIVHLCDSETITTVCEDVICDLNEESTSNLLARLKALEQIALYAPSVFDMHNSTITNFIVKEILLKNRNEHEHGEEDWLDYQNLHDEGKQKIIGVRVLVNRLLAGLEVETVEQEEDQDEDSSAAAMETGNGEKRVIKKVPVLASAVLKMLKRILEKDGELMSDGSTCPAFQSQLRLIAATSLLKLSKFEQYLNMITIPDRIKLSLIIQDPIYQVRSAFMQKLCKYLQNRTLPFAFLVTLMLAAHEPDTELKTQVKSFIVRKSKEQRVAGDVANSLVESTITRFLHLLVHHPDYSSELDDLFMFSAYIEFFLDGVLNSENASFLFHTVAKLKTMRDIHANDSTPLYTLCDMAQYLIKERCTQHSWPLTSYPGNVGFSKELFAKLPSSESGSILKRSYLPSEFVEARVELINEKKTKSRPATPSRRRSTSSRSDADLSSDDETAAVTTEGSAAKKKKRRSSTASKNAEEEDDDDFKVAASSTPAGRRKSSRRSIKSVMKLSESEESEVEGAGDEEVEEENGMELEEGSGPIDGGSDVAQQVTADSLVESEESIPLIKTSKSKKKQRTLHQFLKKVTATDDRKNEEEDDAPVTSSRPRRKRKSD